MTIVTSNYRLKRSPRKKRKAPAIVSAIVTPAPLKPLKGPVIRLGAEVVSTDPPDQPARSAIVEPKRKPKASVSARCPTTTRRSSSAGAMRPASCGAS